MLLTTLSMEQFGQSRIGVIGQRLQPYVLVEERFESIFKKCLHPAELKAAVHEYSPNNGFYDVRESLRSCISERTARPKSRRDVPWVVPTPSRTGKADALLSPPVYAPYRVDGGLSQRIPWSQLISLWSRIEDMHGDLTIRRLSRASCLRPLLPVHQGEFRILVVICEYTFSMLRPPGERSGFL